MRPKMVVSCVGIGKNEKKKLKTAFYSENLKNLTAAKICRIHLAAARQFLKKLLGHGIHLAAAENIKYQILTK